MEYKSLVVGILISIGIFAFKSGVGINYYFSSNKKQKERVLFFSAFIITYFIIFALSGFILGRIDLSASLNSITNLLKSGMRIHILMALLTAMWGLLLLKKREKKKSYAWLIMVVPCPVCISAIFFSLGFLLTFFPEVAHSVTLLLYLSFIVISLTSALFLNVFERFVTSSPSSFLGYIMLSVSIYFILSILLIPCFSDIEKVYQIASFKDSAKEVSGIPGISFFIVFLVLSGFLLKFIKIRRTGSWRY